MGKLEVLGEQTWETAIALRSGQLMNFALGKAVLMNSGRVSCWLPSVNLNLTEQICSWQWGLIALIHFISRIVFPIFCVWPPLFHSLISSHVNWNGTQSDFSGQCCYLSLHISRVRIFCWLPCNLIWLVSKWILGLPTLLWWQLFIDGFTL